MLVSIDTLRADRLGLYGHAAAETPAIDALGRQALVFEAAWTTAPLTLPAHASMLTSLYPPRHGVRANGVHRLDGGVPVVAERFREGGFATGAFVGGFPLDARFGLARGFDRYDDELPRGPSGFHYPERRGEEVVRRALEWLASLGRERQAFLFVHLYDPHAEYAPPAPFAERFAGRPYDGEVAYADAAVGRLLDGLEREGRRAAAAILLTADHGESLGEHGEATHGLLLHEAVLRVPLLLSLPRGRAGRSTVPVSLVDVAPTLLACAGLPPLAGTDGQDVLAARDARRDLYAETLGPYLDHGWSGLRALRRGRLKLVAGPRPALFDLLADPSESADRWPSPEGESLLAALQAASSVSRAPPGAPLDARSREALASLGYASARSDVPADFGVARPDPRERLALARELEAVSWTSEPGSLDAALGRLAELARREPRSNLIQRKLAGARMARGDYPGAIAAYEQAGRLGYAGADLADARAEAHRRAGEACAERGDLACGRLQLLRALELRAESPETLLALGVLEGRAGRLAEAERLFRAATASDTAFAPAWFSLGLALERQGRHAEAKDAYRRFLALAPEASPEREHARAATGGAG